MLDNSLISFLDSYKKLIEIKESFEKEEDFTKLKGFLQTYTSKQKKWQVENSKQAYYFNVFNILSIEHLETKVHSPYIANLLNPEGSHGQGDLFYTSFIDQLSLLHPGCSRFRSYDSLQIMMEKHSQYGFIDISIRNYSKENEFQIIIENKIYADDQERQLERYYRYAQNILKLKDKQILLIYLTPQGHRPSEKSINNELYLTLKNSNMLFELSYNKHIAAWLTSAYKTIKSPKVRYSLDQYLDVVNNL